MPNAYTPGAPAQAQVTAPQMAAVQGTAPIRTAVPPQQPPAVQAVHATPTGTPAMKRGVPFAKRFAAPSTTAQAAPSRGDLPWSLMTIALSSIVCVTSFGLLLPFGLVAALRESDRTLHALVFTIGIIMLVALGMVAYEFYHLVKLSVSGFERLFPRHQPQSGLALAPLAVPASPNGQASAAYVGPSDSGNMAGSLGEKSPDVTGDDATPGGESTPTPAETPPPVPAVPGGTIVGYGQRVEAAAWITKERKKDGFEEVADFDQVKLAEKGWAIVGSSRIGRGHLQDGKYREDAIAAEMVDGKWHLAAVADGGGSYKLARLGAALAVRTAIEAMQRGLPKMAGEPGSHEAKVQRVVEHGLRTAFDALHEEAQRLQEEEERKQSGVTVTVKDLRTTLLLVLHREFPNGVHLVAGGQVGDGAVVVRMIDGDETKLEWLSEPDTGPQGNETTFLTDVPNTDEDWARRVKARLIGSSIVYCLAMTDGISDDFVPLEDNLERLEKPMFQAALGEKDPARAAEELNDLLGYERQASFDDRSLVCIYKQGMAPWK